MIRRIVLLVMCILMSACTTPAPQAPLTEIVVGMPYIPNIQFAHFYMAQEKGYFAEAGLRVTFDYNFENDVVQRLATNNGIQFALASADTVLLARAKGLPITAVMATSQEFPIAFIAKATTPLSSPADLVGKKIGIPGRFGASYIGLQALLRAGAIDESQLSISEIGFNQVPLLLNDTVEVISGYANNEPIQLSAAGTPVFVLRVADVAPIASDHLIINTSYGAEQADTVAKFVAALRKGMQSVAEDPAGAYDASLSNIPEADPAKRDVTIEVLRATVAMWQADTSTLGKINPEKWVQTHALLRSINLLTQDMDVPDAYDVSYVSE
ncbi:MAG: hypothetical protein RL076_76 [Chloroflexota bacterium]